jgi:ubiquinone/menaquinone biosynthesis C-methylase UbiE
VGTGRGLLLIGAARRLTSGRGAGIDVWSTKDLSGNSLERTQTNVEVEGVKEKVTLASEDARKLSFPDASFDVVLSNLCIHNIPDSEGARRPARDRRVLQPGGTAPDLRLYQDRFLPENLRRVWIKVSRTGMNLLCISTPSGDQSRKRRDSLSSAIMVSTENTLPQRAILPRVR